jgi:hypothetical protein
MDQAEEDVLGYMDFPKEDWPLFRLVHLKEQAPLARGWDFPEPGHNPKWQL